MTGTELRKKHLDIVYKQEWQFHWKDYFQKIFPEDYSHPDPEGILRIGMHLKSAGVLWRNQQELGQVLHRLHRIGWIEIELTQDKTKMRFRWKPITWV